MRLTPLMGVVGKSKAVGKPARASNRAAEPELFVEFPVCDQFQPKASSSPKSLLILLKALPLRFFQTWCRMVGMRRTRRTSDAGAGASAPSLPPGQRSTASSGSSAQTCFQTLETLGSIWGLWEELEGGLLPDESPRLPLEVFALNKSLRLLLTASICC